MLNAIGTAKNGLKFRPVVSPICDGDANAPAYRTASSLEILIIGASRLINTHSLSHSRNNTHNNTHVNNTNTRVVGELFTTLLKVAAAIRCWINANFHCTQMRDLLFVSFRLLTASITDGLALLAIVLRRFQVLLCLKVTTPFSSAWV